MLKFVPGLTALAPFFLVMCAGCDRPEVPRSEYGKMVDEYPVFPSAPKTLPLPEGVMSDTDSVSSPTQNE